MWECHRHWVWRCAFGQTNIDSGLAASPYHEIGTDRALAKIKTSFLSEFSAGIIRAECPNLKDKMHVRNAVINWQSRVLEVIYTSGAW
jgi:hypothetical protein